MQGWCSSDETGMLNKYQLINDRLLKRSSITMQNNWYIVNDSTAPRRPCSDFMDMLQCLISCHIIIIIIININERPIVHGVGSI